MKNIHNQKTTKIHKSAMIIASIFGFIMLFMMFSLFSLGERPWGIEGSMMFVFGLIYVIGCIAGYRIPMLGAILTLLFPIVFFILSKEWLTDLWVWPVISLLPSIMFFLSAYKRYLNSKMKVT